MPELLTTDEAAVYLGGKGRPFKPQTLAYWRTIGEGPAYLKLSSKIGKSERGGAVRYETAALDAFLEASRRNPGQAA
jgi:hypothetical protein